jgi:hypothetical protein
LLSRLNPAGLEAHAERALFRQGLEELERFILLGRHARHFRIVLRSPDEIRRKDAAEIAVAKTDDRFCIGVRFSRPREEYGVNHLPLNAADTAKAHNSIT